MPIIGHFGPRAAFEVNPAIKASLVPFGTVPFYGLLNNGVPKIEEQRILAISAASAWELRRSPLPESSAREDLLLGREVQIVGLYTRNSRIYATHVTVYQGKRHGERSACPPERSIALREHSAKQQPT
jgi:hypothetical protein